MIQARAFREFRNRGVSIFIEEIRGSECWVAEPIILRKITDDELFKPDSEYAPLNLKMPAAQKLIDDLWDCGLRPSEGSGSAGQLAAVQKHLEDMRKLLSKVPLVEVKNEQH